MSDKNDIEDNLNSIRIKYTSPNMDDRSNIPSCVKSLFSTLTFLYALLNENINESEYLEKEEYYQGKINSSIDLLRNSKTTLEKFNNLLTTLRVFYTVLNQLYMLFGIDDAIEYLSPYKVKILIINNMIEHIDDICGSDVNYTLIRSPDNKSLKDIYGFLFESKITVYDNSKEDDSDEEDLKQYNQLSSMMHLLQTQMTQLMLSKKNKMENNDHKLSKIMDSQHPDFNMFFKLLNNIENSKIETKKIFDFIKCNFFDVSNGGERIKAHINPFRIDNHSMLIKLAKSNEYCLDVLKQIDEYWDLIKKNAIMNEINKSNLSSLSSLSTSNNLSNLN